VTLDIDQKPTLCFVAHYAYGAMTGGESGHIGGVERQTSFMARWFAARGYRAILVTWDEGQPDQQVIDGVHVIKMCRLEAGVPGLRFFHPRWTSLNRALQRADADVYYQNCGEHVTGQVALWCRRQNRAFVYSVASDTDVNVDLPELKTLRERMLYPYGLRRADQVVAQTRKQQQMLWDGFGRQSVVIPMPCPGPDESAYVPPEPPSAESRSVLWVGRVCEPKRPDRLLALAEQCPELSFDLVGPPDTTSYAQEVYAQAQTIPNVTVHGGVSREAVPGFYQRAACMCCTSAFEGFPNTFLEAWSYGLPIVSTFDPDGLIESQRLGAGCRDVPALAEALRKLLASPAEWRTCSQNAREHYLANYTVESVMPRFERVFVEAAASRRPQVAAAT